MTISKLLKDSSKNPICLILVGLVMAGAIALLHNRNERARLDGFYSAKFFLTFGDEKKIAETKSHMHEDGYTWMEIETICEASLQDLWRIQNARNE
jgi:hypothetical protein